MESHRLIPPHRPSISSESTTHRWTTVNASQSIVNNIVATSSQHLHNIDRSRGLPRIIGVARVCFRGAKIVFRNGNLGTQIRLTQRCAAPTPHSALAHIRPSCYCTTDYKRRNISFGSLFSVRPSATKHRQPLIEVPPRHRDTFSSLLLTKHFRFVLARFCQSNCITFEFKACIALHFGL